MKNLHGGDACLEPDGEDELFFCSDTQEFNDCESDMNYSPKKYDVQDLNKD